MNAVSSKRLLLVEDDPDIGGLLQDFLTDEGYEVRLAKNGQEALNALLGNETRPALILLDLMMPVMDGREFCAARKAHPEIMSIPIVLMSADTNLGESGAALGATAYIKKPLDIDQLLSTVERLSAPKG